MMTDGVRRTVVYKKNSDVRWSGWAPTTPCHSIFIIYHFSRHICWVVLTLDVG